MAKVGRGAVLGATAAGVAVALTATLVATQGGGGRARRGRQGPGRRRKSTVKPVRHAPTATQTPSWDGNTKVIGDGSTSYTGPQPHQPKPQKLKPGEKPPQFVVFSWDGALENDDHLFSHFRELAKQIQREHDVLPQRHLPAAEGRNAPSTTRRCTRPAPPRSTSPPTSTSSGRSSSCGWPGRTATRSAPTSTATSARPTRAPAASGPPSSGRARYPRRTPSCRTGRPTPASRTSRRCPSTTPRSWSAAAPRAWRARRTCCPPPRRSAGATTPARPATSSSGRRSRTGCGTSRWSWCPTRARTSRA